MLKKLSKYGNNMALILDTSILELLDITENTQLKITTDGNSIIITPVTAKSQCFKVSDDPDIQKSFEKVLALYAPALKKLADN